MEEIKNSAGEAAETPIDRAQVEKQLSELAEKLAKQLQQGEAAEKSRRDALNDREKALRKREMAAKTREALENQGLPANLSQALFFEGEEEMEKGVSLLEEAFRTAVQKGVEERLLSSAPKAAPVKPLHELSDEDYYAAMMSRHE